MELSPRVFRVTERRRDWERLVCDDEPGLEIHLTTSRNYYGSGYTGQVSSIAWQVVRDGEVCYSGVEDTPVGDWTSTPQPWREQVQKRLGPIRIEDQGCTPNDSEAAHT